MGGGGGDRTLTLHRPNARLHPHQPFHRLPVLVAVVRERDGVVLVVLLAEVELDRCTFKHPFGLAGSFVDDGWDAAVCYLGIQCI